MNQLKKEKKTEEMEEIKKEGQNESQLDNWLRNRGGHNYEGDTK